MENQIMVQDQDNIFIKDMIEARCYIHNQRWVVQQENKEKDFN